MSFKCGYIALIGQPNAGKSTLLNQVLGSKLAITSAKPQTTRNRIAGVHNEEGMQIILLDTPGIHDAWTELNKAMVRRAMEAMAEVDIVCWLVDASAKARQIEGEVDVVGEQDRAIAEAIRSTGKPVVLLLNKVDVVPKHLLLPLIASFSESLDLLACIPVSALTGDGMKPLLQILREALPEHPPMFPQDEWAQVTERFLAAEIIREKILHLTEQEIPYSAFVEIEQFDEEARDSEALVKIYARIVVERPSQKGIVIGKRGEMLKRIGTLARKEIAGILGCRVYLELFVAVERNWTKSSKGLRKVGF